MPIKLYASTKVLSKQDPESLADDELARISAGGDDEEDSDDSVNLDTLDVESDAEDDEGGFLDEDDSEDESEEESEEDEEDQNNLANLYDLLTAFFKINEAPTDPEFHALAQAIGMEPDDLEAVVYKVMSIMMSNDEAKENVQEAIDEVAEDEAVESDVMPYSPAEAEEDGAPDLDTMPVESSVSKRLRYSLSRR